jgi:hexosaminidase
MMWDDINTQIIITFISSYFGLVCLYSKLAMKNFALKLLLFISIGVVEKLVFALQVPSRTYTCSEKGLCNLNAPNTPGLSQGTCLMTCGNGNLWPNPTGSMHVGKAVSYFSSPKDIKFVVDGNTSKQFQTLVNSMESNFITEINKLNKKKKNSGSSYKTEVTIRVTISDSSIVTPSPNNDESYSLKISQSENDLNVVVAVNAQTIYGMRHALETISQLIVWDDVVGSFAIASAVTISDKPAFKYRGVMIDVSRNFISLEKIEESVRAMGYNKMNVLHLHLSDTASIPITVPSYPNVTIFGAYEDDKIFTVESMENLVEYANGYGVMVLPEIDAPAHMSAGWQWGPAGGLGELVLCTDPDGVRADQWASDSLEPPSGQLNLANENSFNVLNSIYHDVIEQFKSPFFHIGGDEVIVGSDSTWAACYNSSTRGKPIVDYVESLGLSREDPATFYALWENFTMRATAMIQNNYKAANLPMEKLHIWGGGGVDKKGVCYNLLAQENVQSFLPPDVFNIQVWDTSSGSIVPTLIQQGYDVILSNTDYVYLDCGNSGFTNAGGYWCQPYHEWYHIYQYMADVTQKWSLSEEDKKHIFGSETLIWTEMVDDLSVSQKLWPRSAALAEALWSDPQTGWFEASSRMLQWRTLMVARGIQAEALQPLWCQQRAGDVCTLNHGTPQ